MTVVAEMVTVDVLCPENMREFVQAVLDGEYDIPWLGFETPPKVLDIGANVGAFAVWAANRWPGCEIECWEPNPEAFALLEQNVTAGTVLHRAAVAYRNETVAELRMGMHNMGEASLYDIGEQTEETVTVDVARPDKLPAADVIKVDTEGAEVEILQGYLWRRRPKMVLFEFHRASDRVFLDELLLSKGYVLERGEIFGPERGVMCYALGVRG